MYLLRPFLAALVAAATIATGIAEAAPAKSPAKSSLRCYAAKDRVGCFADLAEARLRTVTGAVARADALGEWLYTAAVVGRRDPGLVAEARRLATDEQVPPLKRMDLHYAIDIYAHAADPAADEDFAAAIGLFARLDKELGADDRVALYFGACAIIGWEPALREPWLEFAESACSPESLVALEAQGVAAKALLMAMMPVAMTLTDDEDGFARSVAIALSWLDAVEKATRKAPAAEREFVAGMGALIHTLNARGFDAFEQDYGTDVEVERARRILRRMEARTGVSGRSADLRREVIELLHETGRTKEARKMLREALQRADADPRGKTLPAADQVAFLLQAARLEFAAQAAAFGTCGPGADVDV